MRNQVIVRKTKQKLPDLFNTNLTTNFSCVGMWSVPSVSPSSFFSLIITLKRSNVDFLVHHLISAIASPVFPWLREKQMISQERIGAFPATNTVLDPPSFALLNQGLRAVNGGRIHTGPFDTKRGADI
jgi:hypothetical protein